MTEKEWLDTLLSLAQKIQSKFNYTYSFIGVGICRIRLEGFDIELGSPRVEEFIDNDHSHLNFTPRFISDLDYRQAFKRRDFTINAIGICFLPKEDKLEFQIVDPYEGLSDLKDGVLREIDDDFFKDPVRFLRLIRFHLRFNFKISKSIFDKIKKFNLSKLSLYYFKSEFEKSFNSNFYPIFFNFISKYNLQLAPEILELDFLSTVRSVTPFEQKSLLEVDLALFYKLNKSQSKILAARFGLKYKNFLTMQDLINFCNEVEVGDRDVSVEQLSFFELIQRQGLNPRLGSRLERLTKIYNENSHLVLDVKSKEAREKIFSKIADLLNQEKKA